MGQNTICVVVVTYNRKELLIECLESLLNQTQRLDKIYIVNNASTDGTGDLLRSQAWFDDPRICYECLSSNTGGAGGFYSGLKKAYEHGYDWYWVMDDDVEPEPDCLEKLLPWTKVSECLHPRRFYSDGEFCKWENYISPVTGLRVGLNDISFSKGRKICFVNTACFEGMLVSNTIIEKIGFPDPEFFIVYDDTVYGLKASLFTPVSYVSSALMKKKINKEKQPLSPFFIYYSMRNYFKRQSTVREIYGTKKLVSALVYAMVFSGYFLHIIIRSPEKLKGIKSLLKGAWHGLLKKTQ